MVPRALIKDFFSPSLELLERTAARLANVDCSGVVIAGTPPPRAEITQFENFVRSSRLFQQLAHQRGIDVSAGSVPVTPPVVLRKLWGVIQELMSDIASRTGARFVSVPPEARDERGFLRANYHGDVTHANESYGRLMLERIVLA